MPVIRRGARCAAFCAAKTASACAIAAFMRVMWSRTIFSSAFASARSGLKALRLPGFAPGFAALRPDMPALLSAT
jgi:hypothetical protein